MKVFIYGDPDILVNYRSVIRHLHSKPIVSRDLKQAEDCTHLVLAGGGDILPSLYGQDEICCRQIDVRRDKDELALTSFFYSMNRPILGICRGIQVLNVYFGGDLHQDIATADRHAYQPRLGGDQVHRIHAAAGSFLYSLYGASFNVNSAHHQAAATLGQGLQIAAKGSDGVIEALQHKTKPVYGVQFHPERMCLNLQRDDTVDGYALFTFFLSL